MNDAIERMISELSEEHKPRAPYRPFMVLGALITLAALYLIGFTAFRGLKAPLAMLLQDPLLLGELVLLLLIALQGMYIAAFTPVPGAPCVKRCAPRLHVLSMLYVLLQGAKIVMSGDVTCGLGMHCSCVMWGGLVLPLLSFFFLARRGAVVNAQLAGTSVAVGFGAVSLMVLHLTETMDGGLFILLWIIVPLLLGIVVANWLSARFLRW